jgi:hypothetical protein
LTQRQEEIIGVAILVVRSKGSFTVLVPGVEGKQFFDKGNHLSSTTSHFNRLLLVFLFGTWELIIRQLLRWQYCDSIIVYLGISEVVIPIGGKGRGR